MKYLKILLLAAIISVAAATAAYAGAEVNGNTVTYSMTGSTSVKNGTYYAYLLTDGATIKCYKNMSTQAPNAKLGNTYNRKYLSMAIAANQNNTRTGMADSVRFTYSVDRSGIFRGSITIVNPSAAVTGVAFVVRDSASHYYSINDTQDISSSVYEARNPQPETEAETETETEDDTDNGSSGDTEKESETLSEKEVGKIKDSIGRVRKSGGNKSSEDNVPKCVLERLMRQISS